MKCPCSTERTVQLTHLNEVMVMLFLSKMCYHRAIEIYFEWEKYPDKTDCGKFCTKCKQKNNSFTKRVRKAGVQSLLCKKVDGQKVSVSGFMKLLKTNKELIFHKDDVPKGKEVGQIHALHLQLVAGGIISYDVKDRAKIGTDKLKTDDLFVVCPKKEEELEGINCCKPGYLVDSMWEGLT